MNTQTKTQEQAQQHDIAQEAPTAGKQAVAVLAAPRLPYHRVFEERYGIDGMMWRALVDGVYPSAKTPEGIILAVSYCKAKNYDVMKKMVHVVPIWNSALGKEVEGVWEGVGALRATAFRTGSYAGCDETTFGSLVKKHFKGEVGKGQYAKTVEMDLEFHEWAQVTVYRLVQGVRCAFPGPKVHYLAAYGCQGKSEVPNEKWSEGGGSYMLEKCAEAAALRKAFPEELGGLNAAEEMEGRKVDSPKGPTIDHEPEKPAPPRPTRESIKAEAEAERKADYERTAQFKATMAEETQAEPAHDAETGEVIDSDPVEKSNETAVSNDKSGPKQATSDPPQKGPDHEASATTIIGIIDKASTLINLNKIIGNRSEEIEMLRIEAPELHAKVDAKIAEKRRWFSR